MRQSDSGADLEASAGGRSDCCHASPRGGAPARPTTRQRRAGFECVLHGTLVLDGKRVPAGICWLKQARHEATLSWAAADGEHRAREISPELLRQLLAEGLLQQAGRRGPASA